MKVFNLLTACAIAAPLLFVGCNSDDALNTPDREADGATISFTLGVSAGPADVLSRADDINKDGGNYDDGLPGENQVNNAMIVIYDRPINSTIDGKILKVFYVDGIKDAKTVNGEIDKGDEITPSTNPEDVNYFDPNPEYYQQPGTVNTIKVGSAHIAKAYKKTIKIENDSPLKPGTRYYAVALCNFGNEFYIMNSDGTRVKKTPEDLEEMSLHAFRDLIYTGDLFTKASGNIKGYSTFRMTGINEVSFNWDRKTEGDFNMGQFLVQRLAARVDVSFGRAAVAYDENNNPLPIEFQNQGSYDTDGYMRLALYSKTGDATEYTVSDEYSFYLTDLKIENASKKGTYLIERSASDPKGTPVYFDNEDWKDFSKGIRNPRKFVFSPSGTGVAAADYETFSLAAEAGYTNLCLLVKGGNFYNDPGSGSYYANKRNSSLVGYIPESTCTENYTTLYIEGYTRAKTSAIFTHAPASRAQDEGKAFNLNNPTSNGYQKVVGVIPIMHNTAGESTVMANAVVRNTIYRLRIKVLANEGKIYFRYYYGNNGTDHRGYTASGFYVAVEENNEDDNNIND